MNELEQLKKEVKARETDFKTAPLDRDWETQK